MRLTCCPYFHDYIFHDCRYTDFQTGYFADFEQFKIDGNFVVKTDPTQFTFTDFGQVRVILGSLDKTFQNNPNPLHLTKNSGTTYRIWHKSFSVIQSAGIKK